MHVIRILLLHILSVTNVIAQQQSSCDLLQIEWYTPNEENVIIRKSEFICEKFGWMNATIESHTPLWEDISSISIGDKTLSPEKWGNEKNWTFHKSGGHFFGLGEEWSYRLILKNEDSQ